MDLTAEMFKRNTEYERFMGRWSRRLSPLHVAFAGVKDGARVLDVGAGTGALSLELEATLPAAEIVGIDPSPAFVELATRSAKSERVRFQVGDAQALPFPDAAFDATMSQLVLNFVPDHLRAVNEMRRVTRPGGTVSAVVWNLAEMGMLRVVWDELLAMDPALDVKDERHMKLVREGEVGAVFRAAGLSDVVESSFELEQPFASFADFWEPFLGGVGPAGLQVLSMTEEGRAELAGRLQKRLGAVFTLRARAWCVRGSV